MAALRELVFRIPCRSYAKSEVLPSAEDMPTFRFTSKSLKRYKRMFVAGYATNGRLSFRTQAQKTLMKKTFVPLYMEKRASYVSSGYGFSLLSSKTSNQNNSLFGFGMNTNCQLGFQPSKSNPSKNNEYLTFISRINLPFKNPMTKIVGTACGRAHSLIATDLEGVFSVGCNSYGQCGRRIIPGELSTNGSHVKNLLVETGGLAAVECGKDHSLILTNDGKLYSFGWNADGQLGIDSNESTNIPVLIGGDLEGEQIKQVSSKADTNLAMNHNGDVFGWGNSEYYQLSSVSDELQVNVPRKLPFDFKAKQVACAGAICSVLDTDSNIHVWGYGLLGVGPNAQESAKPLKIPRTLFGNGDVVNVSAGLNHFAAVTSLGTVYVWGLNSFGCLGLNSLTNQSYPFRASVSGKVISASLGVDHSVLIAESIV